MQAKTKIMMRRYSSSINSADTGVHTSETGYVQ